MAVISLKNKTKSRSVLAGNTPEIAMFESIQTVTVGAGGQASVTFTAIPSTYKHLQIRWLARDNFASEASDANMRFNSDSSASYTWHNLYADGSTPQAYALTSQTSMRAGTTAGSTAAANAFAVTVLDILDYANTSKNKTVRNLAGIETNVIGTISLNSGSWMNTAAITSISLSPRVGTLFSQYSSFALYGIN